MEESANLAQQFERIFKKKSMRRKRKSMAA